MHGNIDTGLVDHLISLFIEVTALCMNNEDNPSDIKASTNIIHAAILAQHYARHSQIRLRGHQKDKTGTVFLTIFE